MIRLNAKLYSGFLAYCLVPEPFQWKNSSRISLSSWNVLKMLVNVFSALTSFFVTHEDSLNWNQLQRSLDLLPQNCRTHIILLVVWSWRLTVKVCNKGEGLKKKRGSQCSKCMVAHIFCTCKQVKVHSKPRVCCVTSKAKHMLLSLASFKGLAWKLSISLKLLLCSLC